MPSHLVRGLYGQMAPFLHERMIFVSATKGLENGTLLRMSEVIRQSLETHFAPRDRGDFRPYFRPGSGCVLSRLPWL